MCIRDRCTRQARHEEGWKKTEPGINYYLPWRSGSERAIHPLIPGTPQKHPKINSATQSRKRKHRRTLSEDSMQLHKSHISDYGSSKSNSRADLTIIVLYHHADGAKKGLKNPLVDPRMFNYYPAYNLGISRKLFSKEFPCDSQRSRYRDRESTFPFVFLRNGTSIYTSRKKGTNWCSWRFLKR